MNSKTRLTCLLAVSLAASALADTVNFDDLKTGAPPPGWTAGQTGKGDAKWVVVADDTAPSKPNVLKQSGVATYGVCIKDDTNLKDGFVEVKFKPISGTSDQAGGLIWRAKDTDNYYVTRANALGDNVSIYHTIQGKRVAFKSVSMKVALGEWHTLRVDFAGSRFIVTFDGEKAIEATDDTFADAGKVGVFTRSDSVTLFDDFTYGAKPSSTSVMTPKETPYQTMAKDSLKLVAAGDMQMAWAKMKEVEAQWDAETTDLRAANPDLWTLIDDQMDAAIAALTTTDAKKATDELNSYLEKVSRVPKPEKK
jgi:hypothetical protein